MKIAHSKNQEDKVVNVRQAEQEKQQLINRIKPHKGHKLFEYNIETNEIKESKFEPEEADFLGRKKPKKVIAQKNCLYVSALNATNAIKKLRKRYTK